MIGIYSTKKVETKKKKTKTILRRIFMVITIDGLGVNGKSTLAKRISNKLNFKNNFFGPVWVAKNHIKNGNISKDFGGLVEQGNQILTNLPLLIESVISSITVTPSKTFVTLLILIMLSNFFTSAIFYLSFDFNFFILKVWWARNP